MCTHRSPRPAPADATVFRDLKYNAGWGVLVAVLSPAEGELLVELGELLNDKMGVVGAELERFLFDTDNHVVDRNKASPSAGFATGAGPHREWQALGDDAGKSQGRKYATAREPILVALRGEHPPPSLSLPLSPSLSRSGPAMPPFAIDTVTSSEFARTRRATFLS